jgi:hypothetical protein
VRGIHGPIVSGPQVTGNHIVHVIVARSSRLRDDNPPVGWDPESVLPVIALIVVLVGMPLSFLVMPPAPGEREAVSEPEWWPAFEAQFRAYARAVARDIPRRRPDGDSG